MENSNICIGLNLFLLLSSLSMQGMLTVVRRVAATAKHGVKQQKRSYTGCFPNEQACNKINSMNDLEDYFTSGIEERLTPFFKTAAAKEMFIAKRQEEKEYSRSYCQSSVDAMGSSKIDDDAVPFHFFTSLKSMFHQVGFNQNNINVYSSSHLNESSEQSRKIKNTLRESLERLYPFMSGNILNHWSSQYNNGVACSMVGSVVVKKNKDDVLFIPPTFIVSEKMNDITKDGVSSDIKVIISAQIGTLLRNYVNMNYHLVPFIDDREKMDHFKLLREFQDRVAGVTLDMRDAKLAQKNNDYYRTEGIRDARPYEERRLMLESFLLSGLALKCHRNDGTLE